MKVFYYNGVVTEPVWELNFIFLDYVWSKLGFPSYNWTYWFDVICFHTSIDLASWVYDTLD